MYLFKGTERSGFNVPPGAGKQRPTAIDPLPMHALLDADLWQGMMAEEMIDWQATMFQPIGGMDQIPYGLRQDGWVRRALSAPMCGEIRKTANGVCSDLSSIAKAGSTRQSMPTTVSVRCR